MARPRGRVGRVLRSRLELRQRVREPGDPLLRRFLHGCGGLCHPIAPGTAAAAVAAATGILGCAGTTAGATATAAAGAPPPRGGLVGVVGIAGKVAATRVTLVAPRKLVGRRKFGAKGEAGERKKCGSQQLQ